MSDRQIIKTAKQFVRGLLGKRSTKDQCFIVSTALSGFLRANGLECAEVEGLFAGWHHWWVEMEDGRIIDATSNQFIEHGGFRHRNYWLEKSELHHEE